MANCREQGRTRVRPESRADTWVRPYRLLLTLKLSFLLLFKKTFSNGGASEYSVAKFVRAEINEKNHL
jgi:hypothetical protein